MSDVETLTLEELVTGRGLADLDASPLQRAVCRAAAGEPVGDLLTDDEIEARFGTTELPQVRPTLVALVCGVRGGKSFIGACAAIHACLTVDLSQLKAHELPRFAIVAPVTDAARATFTMLVGILQSSPVLKRFLKGDPTDGKVNLVRPDGRKCSGGFGCSESTCAASQCGTCRPGASVGRSTGRGESRHTERESQCSRSGQLCLGRGGRRRKPRASPTGLLTRAGTYTTA